MLNDSHQVQVGKTLMARTFRNLLLSAAVLCASSVIAPAVHASPLPCTTGFMSTYDNPLGFQCVIGNIVFTFGASSYHYSAGADEHGNPTGPAVADSAVTVTPYGTGLANDPTGFIFSAANWITTQTEAAPGETAADLRIVFSACFTWENGNSGPPCNLPNNTAHTFNSTNLSVGVNLSEPSSLDGNVAVLAGETVQDLGGHSLGPGAIDLAILGNTTSQSLALGGTPLNGSDAGFGANGITVDKDLNLATATPGSVQVNFINENVIYDQAPEPGAFVLAGLGVVLVFLIRRRKKAFGVFGAGLAACLLAGSSANATPIYCGSVATLQQLINTNGAGNGCFIGDVTFNNFAYTTTGNGTVYTASQIDFSVVNSGGQIGFNFNPLWQVKGGQNETINLNFDAVASSGVNGFYASDAASANGTGQIGSTSAASLQIVAPPSTLASVALNYQPPCPANCSTAGGGTFNVVAAGTNLRIQNSFDMSAVGATFSNSAHISALEDTISEVPEPATFILIGSALVGFGCVLRNRAGKKA